MATAPAVQAVQLKHAVVLVHGAGRYGTWTAPAGAAGPTYKPDTSGWFKKAEDTLQAVFEIARDAVHAKFPTAISKTAKFADFYKVVPVNYDSIFEQYRQAWVSQAGKWPSLSTELNLLGLGKDTTAQVRKFLQSGKDDNFGWNNALDVILYLCPLVREHVNAKVMEQISTALAGTAATPAGLGIDYHSWSVIGHSLGTSVMHSAYPRWAKRRQIVGPEVFCAVSNLSRLMDVGSPGDMRPGEGSAPQTYIECRHAFDILPNLRPFNPNWPSHHTGLYSSCVDLDDIYFGANESDYPNSAWKLIELPHEFWHYMYQPEVAGALWSNLLGMPDITGIGGVSADIADAVARKAPGKPDDIARRRLKAKLDGILGKVGDPNKLDNSTIVKLITDFFGV